MKLLKMWIFFIFEVKSRMLAGNFDVFFLNYQKNKLSVLNVDYAFFVIH